jgi:hypothetical protein
MDDHQLLLRQTRHLHGWLASATADVPLASATASPAGAPSIAWQVGHLLRDTETTAEAVAGLPTEEAERGSLPSWGCASATDWDALRARWRARSAACLAALAELAPADLDAAPTVALQPGFEGHLATRRDFWSGHVFHMGYHLGQVGSLRARLGLGWWAP